MATLISEIDCSQHTTREINQAIKQAGVSQTVTLKNEDEQTDAAPAVAAAGIARRDGDAKRDVGVQLNCLHQAKIGRVATGLNSPQAAAAGTSYSAAAADNVSTNSRI